MIIKELLKDYFDDEIDITSNSISILNNLHDDVTCQDLNNRIIWANDTVLNRVNSTLNEVKGEHCYKAFHNLNSPCENCAVVKAQKTGEIEESRVIDPKGRLLLIRAYPIKNNEGKLIGIIDVSLNITKQKRLQEEIECFIVKLT
ncbi:PAS domain-containing protein [Selenihalanaerobacter shriftii]|uniref:PAS domain-containing protein n=1 Tax=Selenihalanaerobacter shriftii TaxID=142842 RepID=A0A1T4NYR6_9FIRM|nr:PAS domain-containing protein [Selenihalanaerobacter shriftii]SJZ84319.1 PAS domain-containing protein [Selenihalanaerobacter shriftii]